MKAEDKALIADPPMYHTPNDVAEHVVEEHKKEMVNSPQHYQLDNGMEVIDLMRELYGNDAVMWFSLCSAYKYISRCMKKHKTPIEDLRKAQYYINLILENEDNKDRKE